MDETLATLENLRDRYAAASDTMSVAVLESMIQLYVIGRINIEFSDTGEPIATPAQYAAPLISSPLFSTGLYTDTEVKKNPIGFRVN